MVTTPEGGMERWGRTSGLDFIWFGGSNWHLFLAKFIVFLKCNNKNILAFAIAWFVKSQAVIYTRGFSKFRRNILRQDQTYFSQFYISLDPDEPGNFTNSFIKLISSSSVSRYMWSWLKYLWPCLKTLLPNLQFPIKYILSSFIWKG